MFRPRPIKQEPTMSQINTILIVLFSVYLITCIKCQSKICFIGDNLYGDVTNPWSDKQDPRILMGTYTKTTTIQDTGESQLNVDFNSPIYKHTNYGGSDGTNYIFKITDIGWVITEDTSPNQVTAENIKLTCFQDDIIDCIKYSWFWSYNSNIDSVQSVKISNGNCPSYDR